MKRLSSPEKVPTAAATGLWGRAEGGAGPGAEDDEPAGPGTETEDKRAGTTSDGCPNPTWPPSILHAGTIPLFWQSMYNNGT